LLISSISKHHMNVLFRRCVIALIYLSSVGGATCWAQQAETSPLLEAAKQGSGQSRYAAIDDLGETHHDAARVVPQLTALLEDDDPQIRWRSARSLGDYGDRAQSAADELRNLLGNDSSPIARYHAAVALGSIGDRTDETVRALVTAATSKDSRIARAAIAALRNIQPGPEHLSRALAAVLQSEDEAVLLYALEAIVERGAEAVPLLNEALKRPETQYLACAAIEQIGPAAADTVPALVEVLRNTRHSKLQIQALLALAKIGSAAESAAPHVVPLLESQTDATVPVAAAFALGAIGAEGTDEALRKALTKDNPFLNMVAAWSLAKLHPDDQHLLRQAVDRLSRGLGSSEPHIRTAAAKGLQMLQPPPEMVAPRMVALANDPDPEVRANAIDAIAGLGEQAVPRVVRALQNPELRSAAVQVLNKMGPKAADAVQPLMAAAASADPPLKAEIHFALAAIGPAAAGATDMLADAVMSDDPHISESALYALRQIGEGAASASDELLERMQADDSFASLASAWALARIAPDDARSANKVINKLVESLSSATDEQTRRECIEALAKYKSNDTAAAILRKAAQDDDSPGVRTAAEAALGGGEQ
jgi:HEAT repeat protein